MEEITRLQWIDKKLDELEDEEIEAVLQLVREIPTKERLTRDDLVDRLNRFPQHRITLVKCGGDEVISVHIAYEKDESTWYLWLGCTREDWRGRGIAKRYFSDTERRAREEGYERLEIKVPTGSRLQSHLMRRGWRVKEVNKSACILELELK